jgi:hypothetical protein
MLMLYLLLLTQYSTDYGKEVSNGTELRRTDSTVGLGLGSSVKTEKVYYLTVLTV